MRSGTAAMFVLGCICAGTMSVGAQAPGPPGASGGKKPCPNGDCSISEGHSTVRAKRLDGTRLTAAQIDGAVAKAMAHWSVPGVGLAVINDGRLVYVKGYGYRDVERKLPFEPWTSTYAASLTKCVFGYAVLQLVDQGKIALDTPIDKYLAKPLPEYSGYEDLAGDERWRKFTPRILLAHTSGLPNYRGFEDDKKLKIHFEPGTRYAYSGEGLNLLAMVIEEATHEKMEDIIARDVFVPFGMKDTAMTYQPRFDANHAIGYDEKGVSLGPNEHMHVRVAGSMHTTAADYAKFLVAVANGERLSLAMRAEMLKPQIRITSKHEFPPFATDGTTENDAIKLSYGLTWGLYFTPPYGEAYFKEGHDDGWRNYAVCFDRGKDCVLIMTNSSNGEHIYDEVLRTIQGNTFTPVEWEGFAK
jgi:CubicO group peptidase (beta-lactamase class C family)